jgi:hypothetical protein
MEEETSLNLSIDAEQILQSRHMEMASSTFSYIKLSRCKDQEPFDRQFVNALCFYMSEKQSAIPGIVMFLAKIIFHDYYQFNQRNQQYPSNHQEYSDLYHLPMMGLKVYEKSPAEYDLGKDFPFLRVNLAS